MLWNQLMLMNQRIRVVFFHIGRDSFGGGSKMLLRLLQSLNRRLFDPILLSQKEDKPCERVRKSGVDVQIVPFKGILDTYDRQLLTTDPRVLIPVGFRILQFNRDVRQVLSSADIIWCQNLRAVLTIGPSVVAASTPVIWNIGLGLKPDKKIKFLNSIGLRMVEHAFIESKKQAETIFTETQWQQHREKFSIFHKGIDTSYFDPDQYGDIDNIKSRVGTAALINPRKGLEYFIDAAAMVLKDHPETHFTIAGEPANQSDKNYKAKLEQQVIDYGIKDKVEFVGWVEDMPEYLNSLDLFVLPSHNEGIPGAVREALAMRVPAIATDVGGTSEVVIDGETGFLVEPEDAQAIANAISRLLNAPETRAKMGQQGRGHIVSEFSMASYVRNYEQFLGRIHKS